ncbi:hypothetical protein JS528_04930 [Bifidobacterium sp. MA2]|uniref:DUF5648 domain-containing protein n=1 Tax=Bifidobacterium santillanense TaxID=2809028 RepID=A0ABS5UPH1_9BIFI|nr:hypothetical protein [Bifidobacterium santillanense]MBT1172705.1 hypothetical protein [Bifidobacterium santillanense]
MRRLGKIAALLVAVGTMFAGASVANADETSKYEAVKITGVQIEDVGAHTAGLKVSYTVDPAYRDQIKSICPVAYLYDITSIRFNNPKNEQLDIASAGFPWDADCTGILDPDVTQSDYERMYGERTWNYAYNGDISVDVTGHRWTRFYQDAWDTDKRPTSGTFDMTLVGLEPNHFYGNRNVETDWHYSDWDTVMSWVFDNKDKAGQTVRTDIHQLSVGARVEYTDGTNNSLSGEEDHGAAGLNAASVPGFTTIAEPKTPSEQELLGSSKNGVTPQDGNAKRDSVYRLYLKDLSATCKAQLESGVDPCVWYGYIYSTPTRLTSPTGAPYLGVQKDDKATDSAKQYYVDVYIPKTVADGEHRILLTDNQGKSQGWTPVTVGEADSAETTAGRLYDEWGDPIVDESLQKGRGELTDPATYTKESLAAYKTALAAFAQKLSGIQQDALNSTDRTSAVALLAKQENLNDLYAELDNAHAKLVKAVKEVTVYRLFNPNETRAGSHHYTSSKAEIKHLVSLGWKDEGVAFVTVESGKPVYRAYNPNDGSHFYTLSKTEFDHAVRAGWHDEGIGFHVSDDAKVPLYRVYNPNSGEHFYTVREAEVKFDVAHGWKSEDIAWNVIK